MPFEQGAPMSFTAVSVQNNAPDCSGVYGLSNSSEWIFIGEANNIRAALMEHLRESGSAPAGRRPRGFSYEVAPAGKRTTRRAQLARELTPARTA